MGFTVLVLGAFSLVPVHTKSNQTQQAVRYAGLVIMVPIQGAGMQLHEAFNLIEAYSVSSANSAVQEGWTLLAVVPGANGVIYVLGKRIGDAKLNVEEPMVIGE